MGAFLVDLRGILIICVCDLVLPVGWVGIRTVPTSSTSLGLGAAGGCGVSGGLVVVVVAVVAAAAAVAIATVGRSQSVGRD